MLGTRFGKAALVGSLVIAAGTVLPANAAIQASVSYRPVDTRCSDPVRWEGGESFYPMYLQGLGAQGAGEALLEPLQAG